MAKSDLLKQAIADAKAVKETALANAKLALQEAFAPRLETILQTELMKEIDDEEMDMDAEMGAEAGMEADAEMSGDMPDMLGIGVDYDNDGSYDYQGDLSLGDAEDEMEAGADEMEAGAEDDLNLEEILAELEMGADEENPMGSTPQLKPVGEGNYNEGKYNYNEGEYANEEENEDLNIEAIIEAILAEEEEPVKVIPSEETPTAEAMEAMHDENMELKAEITEAYRTVKHLQSVINEVNLLNAKLLYTNKLFRNFDLNEGQKMKVIENFDRAVSAREAKLVFATLAESFNKPAQKRKMVKESAASRPLRTTAPSQQTTQILSEGFEMANRWKKLAGLI